MSDPNQNQDAKATDAVEDQNEPVEVTVDETVSEEVVESPAVEEAPVAASESDDPTPSIDHKPEEMPMFTPGMNWFVLRVASNKEDYVKETLLRKIKIEGLTHLVARILVPTEKVKTMKNGKQRITARKLYPGYVFVEMKLEDDGRIPQDVFFLIKETTGVGDFIGTAGHPAAMGPDEVEKMIMASRAPEEEPSVQMEFQPGDIVKIKEGPFENMDGTVDVLLPDQGKVRVIVTIFGRATPLEIEYWQIEKSEDA